MAKAPWTTDAAAPPPPPSRPKAPWTEEPSFLDRMRKFFEPDPAEVAQLEQNIRPSYHVGGAGSDTSNFGGTHELINTDFDWRAIPSAVRNIVEGIPKAGSALVNWERENIPYAKDILPAPLTNQEIEAPISGALGIAGMSPQGVKEYTQHQPQNLDEQIAMGAIEFAPNLIGGGAPLATKLLTRVAAPMAAMEGAGAVAGEIDPSLEQPAKILAGILAGGRPIQPTAELGRIVQALNTTKGGVRAVAEILRQSGMPPGEIITKLRDLGMDATLLDVNPGALQAGEQVFARGGGGRTILNERLGAREEATPARVEQGLRTNVGPRVDETAQLKALEDRLSRLGGEQRQAASTGQTQPADLQSIIDDIDTRLGTEKSPSVVAALKAVRDSLHIKQTAPNQPAQLEVASEPILSARQAIRERLYDANGQVKAGIGPKEEQVLKELYAKINQELDVSNPSLRGKDAEIEQAAKEQRAYQTGKKDVLRGGEKAISPEEFATTWNAMSAGEKAQVHAGLTRRIDAMVGLKANDRVALKQAITKEGKWNHQKIAQIIGQDKANELVRMLERESTFQATHNRITQNSKTAETITIDRGHPAAEFGKDVLNKGAAGGALAGIKGAVGGGVLAGANKMLSKLGDIGSETMRTELARLLSSNNPEKVMRAVELMRSMPGRWQSSRLPAAFGAAAFSQQDEGRR